MDDIIVKDDSVAALQIRPLGSEVTPYLASVLETKDSLGNTLWVKLWPWLPAQIQKRLAVPVLARDARMRALATLRDIGEPARAAIPALVERLSDKDFTIRLHAAIALGNIGPAALEAKPLLLPRLSDESHTVRSYVANAVWKISQDTNAVLPVLEKAVKETGAKFRWATVVFLGEMGPAAERAIPLLEEAARSPDLEVASLALQSLAQISPQTLPFVATFVEHASPDLRLSAIAALGRHGPSAKDAVPLLVKALADGAQGSPAIMGRALGSERVKDAAAAALKQIDPEAAKKAGLQ